jgi:hypothetical protein
MVLVSLLLLGMWFQAVHKGFIESGQGPGQWWREVVPVAVAAVFGISIAVAQYNPRWAILTWLLLLVPLDRWLPPQGPGPTPVEQHSG